MSEPRHGRPAVEQSKPAEPEASDPKRPAPTPEVAAAAADVAAARAALALSLDELTDAAKSAVDIPAKVRRNPGKTLALAGGAGFLVAGGPRRVLRAVTNRVAPSQKRDPGSGLLPDEIDRVLRDSTVAKDPEVRRAIEADFADYLRRKGKVEPEPTPALVFWRTFDRVAGPLGTAGARLLVMRLMEAEKARARVRAEESERQRLHGG
jgi:hypothetical protein